MSCGVACDSAPDVAFAKIPPEGVSQDLVQRRAGTKAEFVRAPAQVLRVILDNSQYLVSSHLAAL